MRHPNPDVVLGIQIREMRVASGHGIKGLADAMFWPVKRLVALEEGAGIAFTDLVALVGHLGIDLEEFSQNFATNLAESHVDFNQLQTELDFESNHVANGDFLD